EFQTHQCGFESLQNLSVVGLPRLRDESLGSGTSLALESLNPSLGEGHFRLALLQAGFKFIELLQRDVPCELRGHRVVFVGKGPKLSFHVRELLPVSLGLLIKEFNLSRTMMYGHILGYVSVGQSGQYSCG